VPAQVLTVGSYASEDDAARAWNAAALHFRGPATWQNPVQPALPEDGGTAVTQGLADRGYPAFQG
jgi:hypothetical protein